MMYTGKPLVTSKGAVQRRIDHRQMFIHGNLANAMMGSASEDDADGRVPSSWELVRRPSGGQTEVIANRVLAYDLASDGSALYCDGAAITRLGPDGHSERVLRAEQIERLVAL